MGKCWRSVCSLSLAGNFYIRLPRYQSFIPAPKIIYIICVKIVLMTNNCPGAALLHVYKWFCFSFLHFSQHLRSRIRQSVENIDYRHFPFKRGTGVMGGSFKVQWTYWEGCGRFAYDACQKKSDSGSDRGSGCVSYGAEVMGASHATQHPVEGMAH